MKNKKSKKTNTKKKKKNTSLKGKRLQTRKFSAPPSEDENTLPSLETILTERFSASSLSTEVLGNRLLEAQESIVRAQTEGWDCPWTPRSAVIKIRQFLRFLDLEISKNYSQLCKYSVTKNRSSRVNSVFLIFNVKIQALILLSRFEKPEILDLDALAKDGILMYEKITTLSQTELFESIQCVSSKWFELRPSEALWKYLFALQKRAAVLCAMRGGAKTFDGRENWKQECSKEYLAASQEYISDIATQFALFFRARDIREYLLVETLEIRDPPYEDLDRVAGNVTDWLKKHIQTYEDGSFRGQVKNLILEQSKRPGESERYSRAHTGVVSQDVPAVLDVSRSNLEIKFLTDLGKKGIRDFLDEAKAGEFVTSLVLLKVFNAYLFIKTELSWWEYCFLGEDECMEKGEILRYRKMPVIVQTMGSFDVFYKKELYKTDTASRALALWSLIIIREHGKEYSMINGKWDLSVVAKMFKTEEEDDSEEEDDEVNEDFENAIIEMD